MTQIPLSLVSLSSSRRGRLAPSPTGRLHLGNAFTFLMAWLSVRSGNGTLALRMEDIDPERSRPGFSQTILEDLAWLGLFWDEGPSREELPPNTALPPCVGQGGVFAPYSQSLRGARYAAALEYLRCKNLAYPCYCTRKELRMLASAPHIGDEGVPYPGTCLSLSRTERTRLETSGKKPCWRLNIVAALASLGEGDTPLAFTDGVLGPQRLSPASYGGDFALCRSDGVYAYQLVVALDDAAMHIHEIVRGNDLLLSTPRQRLLFPLMGHPTPRYAHVPLLHDAQGERLAKRHKALEIAALRADGVAPDAIIGFLGFLARLPVLANKVARAAPSALIPGFSLSALKEPSLRLPENFSEFLKTLSQGDAL